jgi:hypothetical protein
MLRQSCPFEYLEGEDSKLFSSLSGFSKVLEQRTVAGSGRKIQ